MASIAHVIISRREGIRTLGFLLDDDDRYHPQHGRVQRRRASERTRKVRSASTQAGAMASPSGRQSSPFNRQASHHHQVRSASGSLPYPSPLRPASWAPSPGYTHMQLPSSASGSNLARHASPFAAGSSPPHAQAPQPWGLPRPGSGVSPAPFGVPHFPGVAAWPPMRPDSRGSAGTATNARTWPAAPGSAQSFGMEDWPKEWSWTGVDIPVHGVKALREDVERGKEPTAGTSEGEDGVAGGDLGVGGSHAAMATSEDDEGQSEVVSYTFGADRWKVELGTFSPKRWKAVADLPRSPSRTSLFPPINTHNLLHDLTLPFFPSHPLRRALSNHLRHLGAQRALPLPDLPRPRSRLAHSTVPLGCAVRRCTTNQRGYGRFEYG